MTDQQQHTTLGGGLMSSSSTTTTTTISKTPLDYIKEYEIILSNNPNDYYTWEKYIKVLEIESSTASQQEALLKGYEKFLSQFPLLFGYWKKYATLTFQVTQSYEKTIQVYEKSIDKKTGIYNNPDLWANYCLFVAEQSPDVSEIRNLFERAIKIIGNDYYARTLWENYIEFEISQEEYEKVVRLYKRAIQVPCRDLTLIWSQFKDFLKKHYEHATNTTTNTNTTTSNGGGDGTTSDVNGGDVTMNDTNNNTNTSNNNENSSSSNTNIKQIIQTKEEEAIYLQSQKLNDLTSYWREQLYMPTKKELERIRVYEDVIRRPYFHPQPFQDYELEHFRKYIQNEKSEYLKKENKWCDQEHLIQTFERFIVYCSYYIEFWNLYFDFLKSENLNLNELYDRLINFSVLKDKYYVTLQYIEYLQLENQNDEKIEELYNNLINVKSIGHLESILNCINYYQRKLNYSKVEFLFENNLNLIKGENSKCFFMLEFIKFNWKVKKDLEKTRSLFNQCLLQFSNLKKPYQAYLEFESQYLIDHPNDLTHFEFAINFILQLDFTSNNTSNTSGGSDNMMIDNQQLDEGDDNTVIDKTVKHYMSMWGLLPNNASATSESSSNSNTTFDKVTFKIEVLKLLKHYTSQYFNSLEKIHQIKSAITKLEEEHYENQKKRRLDGISNDSKKIKTSHHNINSSSMDNNLGNVDQRWTLDQYKQYYQQYYQYYQQFTQI